MWPWGHLAVGYLVYSLLSHIQWGSPPREYSVLALTIGTQFPDVIDKPLAWTFGVLPTGRSLAHSILTVVLVLALLRLLVRHRHSIRLVTAFGVGYLAHLGADSLQPLLTGDYASVRFLAWPLLRPIDSGTAQSFLAHFGSIEVTSFFAFELGLVGLAIGVWIADGAPGLAVIRDLPHRAYAKLGL